MTGSAKTNPLVVLHLMRTYGAHGGENQLARYFSTEPQGGIEEHFAFIYRDPDCTALFQRAGARLTRHELIPFAVAPRQSAWAEVLMLLPLLPFLQLRFAALLHRTRPSVCVVHGIQAALVAWPTAMLSRRRIGFLYVHRITKSMGRNKLLRWLYAPYRKLGGVSQAVTRSLAPIAGESRLVALENGIDWKTFVAAAQRKADVPAVSRGPILVSVGRLLRHKRQDMLIEAATRLAPQHPGLELWIVGDGPARGDLEAAAARSGIGERIRFWGYRSDVAPLLAAATLFVNASSWEGMSNAVLEAMALGLASVVCDAPGVTECHVAGETGLVVPGDAGAIAAAVETLLSDPERRATMGAAAAKRIREHYSMEANRRRFLALYAELAGAA